MLKHPGEKKSIKYMPSSSIILFKTDINQESIQIYLVKRREDLKFFPGQYAGIGGKVEKSDKIFANFLHKKIFPTYQESELNSLVCAWRELFEEVGICLLKNLSESKTLGMKDFVKTKQNIDMTELFNQFDLNYLDLEFERFFSSGIRTTPEFAYSVFITQFYMVSLDNCAQKPVIDNNNHELSDGLWDSPKNLFKRFMQNKLDTPPPVLGVIRELAERDIIFPDGHKFNVPFQALEILNQNNLLPIGLQTKIEVVPGIQIIPFRTRTIAPAYTTNLIIIGALECLIVDPGTNNENELNRLDQIIEYLLVERRKIKGILLTHHHLDHREAIKHLTNKFNFSVYLSQKCYDQIEEKGEYEQRIIIADNEVINLGIDRENGLEWNLKVLELPGHTKGHVCLLDQRFNTLIAGDIVSGIGTVIIDDYKEYMNSLERLQKLEVGMILPGHGPMVKRGHKLINDYIIHRKLREKQIITALDKKIGKTPKEIVEEVYTDVPVSFHLFAEQQVNVYLKYFEQENLIFFNPTEEKYFKS
ncbi:MAG: MBL fold metallo-hydrolase [Candidatus Thorarchaeota archaeon]